MAEGTFSCRRLIREVIRDFGWREDFAAEETAALFRFFYLFLVAEAAIVSLAEYSVFLLLFFLLFLSLFQIPLESSLKIERHMIVRGEDIQRRNMVVVFDQFSLTVIHSFRKTFPVVVQQSHWNLRDIIAEGILHHQGNGSFKVVSSENTRLAKDDTFECRHFINHEPAYLHAWKHGDDEPVTYVIGKKNGIIVEHYLED